MPKLKVLSGKEVIEIFVRYFGFVVATQKGSHVKLSRMTTMGHKQNLTIPNHKEIDRGTLKAIFRQANQFIQEQELVQYFYEK